MLHGTSNSVFSFKYQHGGEMKTMECTVTVHRLEPVPGLVGSKNLTLLRPRIAGMITKEQAKTARAKASAITSKLEAGKTRIAGQLSVKASKLRNADGKSETGSVRAAHLFQ